MQGSTAVEGTVKGYDAMMSERVASVWSPHEMYHRPMGVEGIGTGCKGSQLDGVEAGREE